MSMSNTSKPHAHLEGLVSQVKAVTKSWANKHGFWLDTAHVDPLKQADSEPGAGEPPDARVGWAGRTVSK